MFGRGARGIIFGVLFEFVVGYIGVLFDLKVFFFGGVEYSLVCSTFGICVF